MKKSTKFLITFLFLFQLALNSQTAYKNKNDRNPLEWPFSTKSIWNMPIGSKAVYVDAKLQPALISNMTVDEDYIVMTPNEQLMEIYKSDAGWSRKKSRCEKTGDLLYSVPIPQNFIVSPKTWNGATPNAGIAVLMPDGRTIKQNQPFAHCEDVNYATTGYLFEDQDIYGNGLYGAHGGSGLSAIGGTLRVGELTPTSGPIRHALKINLFGSKNIYYDCETKGYRWPACKSDDYAEKYYYKERTYPIVKACRMGALLALPAKLNIDSLKLETEPAKILAKAFQDYGAYIVDDTFWDVNAIATEWGPNGRFSEEFEKNWGFKMSHQSIDHPWSRDIEKIFAKLHVVDNNSATSIGGGGIPRAPLAPKLKAPKLKKIKP